MKTWLSILMVVRCANREFAYLISVIENRKYCYGTEHPVDLVVV